MKGRLGTTYLARKYGINSARQIIYWINAYKQHGEAGLSRKKINEVYPVQFKLDVLSFMKRTGASRTQAAAEFGMINPQTITSWYKKFLEGGAEALAIPKGRPAMSKKAKNVKKTAKPPKQDKMTREQRLERENELLRLEVAYLKKLRAFQKDPDVYLEKHKQHYRSNSKRNSD